MFGLGFWEVVLIAVAVLLLFGSKDLPKVARQVGRVMFQVKRATRDLRDSLEFELDEDFEGRSRRRPQVLRVPDEPPDGYPESLRRAEPESEPLFEPPTEGAPTVAAPPGVVPRTAPSAVPPAPVAAPTPGPAEPAADAPPARRPGDGQGND